MLNNISTKRKLMLLPIAFIGIVIVSSLIFTYFNNAAEQRTNAAVQTDLFIQQVLKGRISVYQFLRSPDEQKAQKVRDDFNTLNNSVLELKAKLTSKENIDLSDLIINESKKVNLLNSELNQIANSVFKYWKNGTIRYGAITTKKDINEGIMNFPKMQNLSKEDYDLETKRRRKISAIRTINIRDKENNKVQLLEAKKNYEIKKQEENQEIVLKLVLEFENQGKKINFSEIAKLCNLDRRTVKKYYQYK